MTYCYSSLAGLKHAWAILPIGDIVMGEIVQDYADGKAQLAFAGDRNSIWHRLGNALWRATLRRIELSPDNVIVLHTLRDKEVLS